MIVRPGKKFGFQSAAKNLQLRRRPNRLRQTVPDRCSSRLKGAVANGRTHSACNDQRWCEDGTREACSCKQCYTASTVLLPF